MLVRLQKINELIKQQTAEIISREISIKPGVFVTVSNVDTTPDFRYARVFISVFPEKERGYVEASLRKEQSVIQRLLNKKMCLRILPQIGFVYDETEVKAEEVERILRSIEKEKNFSER